MSLITSKRLFSSFFGGVNNLSSIQLSLNQTRCYAFKSDLKIKWVRPEKIPCIHPMKSGDLSSIPSMDLNQYPTEYQNSVELADADPLVKKMFTLEFNTRSKAMQVARMNIVDSVKRHDLDKSSTEARIASMTGEIRNLQQIMESYPRNKRIKVHLKEMIDKRKKHMKYLRRWDYKRFEWLLEKLDLVYKSPPSEFKWITRKDSLRKLTDEHCNNLREDRLKAYRAVLDTQKQEFLQKKLDTLEWILEEEEACKVPPSVSKEEIESVRKQIEELQS